MRFKEIQSITNLHEVQGEIVRIECTMAVRDDELFKIAPSLGKFTHCLYLKFRINQFPNLPYPSAGSYEDSVFEDEMNWHGGITYYDCFTNVSGAKDLKIGCDYQHFGDESYINKKRIREILETDGKERVEEFRKLVEKYEKGAS